MLRTVADRQGRGERRLDWPTPQSNSENDMQMNKLPPKLGVRRLGWLLLHQVSQVVEEPPRASETGNSVFPAGFLGQARLSGQAALNGNL